MIRFDLVSSVTRIAFSATTSQWSAAIHVLSHYLGITKIMLRQQSSTMIARLISVILAVSRLPLMATQIDPTSQRERYPGQYVEMCCCVAQFLY